MPSVLVRFPALCAPLAELLDVFLRHDIAGDVWLDDELRVRAERSPAFAARCRCVADALAGRIAAVWHDALLPAAVAPLPARHHFVWLLEEWVLCMRLLGDRHSATFRFPLPLRCPPSLLGALPPVVVAVDNNDDGDATPVVLISVADEAGARQQP